MTSRFSFFLVLDCARRLSKHSSLRSKGRKRIIHASKNAEDEDVVKVVWPTFHVNFVAMVIANIAFVPTCLGISACNGNEWRTLFAGSIVACGAYWFYTHACEKKLVLFLQTTGVYPRGGQTNPV
jgi:hypothetical protein